MSEKQTKICTKSSVTSLFSVIFSLADIAFSWLKREFPPTGEGFKGLLRVRENVCRRHDNCYNQVTKMFDLTQRIALLWVYSGRVVLHVSS